MVFLPWIRKCAAAIHYGRHRLRRCEVDHISERLPNQRVDIGSHSAAEHARGVEIIGALNRVTVMGGECERNLQE